MNRSRIRLAGAVGTALLALAGWWLLGPRSEAPGRAPRGKAPPASEDRALEEAVAAPVPAVETTPEQALAATVVPAIRGVVVDADGAPASGAAVRLGAASTTTDAAGAFSIPMPPDPDRGEPATLLASKEGHGTAQVEVQRGGPRDLRVVLPIASEIAGEVLGPSGPIGGARVTLRDGAWRRTVDTDAAGRFRFPEARTTWCELVATAKDHRPAGLRVPGGIERRTVRILLDVEKHEFAIRVVDAEGRPVAGAVVVVRSDRGSGDFVVEAVSDANGIAFPLSRTPRVLVSATAEGFAPGFASIPWQLTEDVVVVLHREAELEVQAADSLDATECAAWTFALGWNDVREPIETESGFGGSRHDRTGTIAIDRWVRLGADGRARIRGARAGGAYAIVGQRRDDREERQSFRLIVWKTESLPEGHTAVEWSPPGLVPVEIRVRDGESDRGVSSLVRFDADPEALAPHRDRIARGSTGLLASGISVRTRTDGAAVAWLWPGRYRVTAYGGLGISHEPRAEGRVEVGAEGASVTLRLPRGTVVRGRLRTADGTPLPGRQVHLNGEADKDGVRLLLFGNSDNEGRFEVIHVPDGPYSIWAQGIRMELMAPDPPRITAPCGELDLVVTGCTLRGDIRPAPEGHAIVRVQQVNGGVPVEEMLDDTGAFEVRGLSPGPKSVVVYGPRGEMLGTVQVTVADGTFVSVVRAPPPGPEAR